MAKKTDPLLPSTDELLKKLGVRLRLARLRRKLTAKQVAERSGMSPITFRNIEHGEPGVTIGAYIAVMQVLGIEKDLNYIAEKDSLGRELQDSRLPQQGNSFKEVTALQPGSITTPTSVLRSEQTQIEQTGSKKKKSTAGKIEAQLNKADFKSSSTLAQLLDFKPTAEKKRK